MLQTNVLVAGGRSYLQTNRGCEIILFFFKRLIDEREVKIVQGGAVGADAVGGAFATFHGLDQYIHYADWDRYGKRAGMLRNAEMVEIADYAIFFWDGSSRGTKNSIDLTKAKGIPYVIIYYSIVDDVLCELKFDYFKGRVTL